MTGVFIDNSKARGCFVVLESKEGLPDVFRALVRKKNVTAGMCKMNYVPSSNYTMLVYDLERNGIPNRVPAIEPNDSLTVRRGSDSTTESDFLVNATLSFNGPTVVITCDFKNSSGGASCLLVYREYGNKTLVPVEYNQTTIFPVSVAVDPGSYTFSIFGKNNNHIDERPFETRRIVVPLAAIVAGNVPLPPV
jgi:hypothetical protein